MVLPTWNRLPYLREAVRSVLRQTYPRWELIVVDDASGDDTLRWLESVGDPRVRWLTLPHSGNLGKLRNRGVAEARGDLIAFLDSDDAFEPRKLEVQLGALAAHPECGWSYTAMTRVDAQGTELRGAPVGWRELSGWILEEILSFQALVDAPAVMIRRELLERAGTLDESLPECQDYELFFRLAAVSPAVMVAEPLTRKRIHAGSTNADRVRVNEAWVVVYERFAATSPKARVQRICARQARYHRLSAASWRGRRGGFRLGLPPAPRLPVPPPRGVMGACSTPPGAGSAGPAWAGA